MRILSSSIMAASFILLSVLLSSFSIEPNFNTDYENDVNAQKLMTREFNANNSTTLQVTNSYGNIKVVPWSQNKIKVDVYVKYNKSITNTQEYREKSFKIEMSENDNVVKVETKHLRQNIKHTINYVIYAPCTVKNTLSNRYGDIVLGNFSGYANINSMYGNLFAENLSFGDAQKANDIKVSYGDASIKSASWLNTRISYGSIRIGSCYAIGLNLNYSDASIEKIKFINSASNFSDLNVVNANSIKGKFTHSDLKVDKLTENLIISATYSDIVIKSISKELKNIDVECAYTDGKIWFDNGSEFRIEGNGTYSGFKLYNMGEGSQNIQGSFERTVGKDSGKVVKITAKYGDWLLSRN